MSVKITKSCKKKKKDGLKKALLCPLYRRKLDLRDQEEKREEWRRGKERNGRRNGRRKGKEWKGRERNGKLKE